MRWLGTAVDLEEYLTRLMGSLILTACCVTTGDGSVESTACVVKSAMESNSLMPASSM
jgi:hypothetical protein